jgi:hypothetical protein
MDCSAVALECLEPDGREQPLLLFPLDQIHRGQARVRAPALLTAPSARSGVPVKHMPEDDWEDDGPQPLVSGLEGQVHRRRIFHVQCCCHGARTRSAQLHSSRTACNLQCAQQGLGGGQAACYWAYCTNQAAEGNRNNAQLRLASPHCHPAHSGIRPLASYFQQGSIHLPLPASNCSRDSLQQYPSLQQASST